MRSMTGQELLDLLSELPDETLARPIIFSVDYGDYSHRQQALPLRGEFRDVTIKKSAYSQSGFAIVDQDNEDDTDPRQVTGYLLVE